MATDAQILANRANSQRSTGPKTEQGKAASSGNNFRYGFCGKFRVLSLECQEEFDALLQSLREEHQPSTTTERILVDKMAEHYWLSRRAQHLQDLLLGQDLPPEQFQKEFALFIRYQTTHDRAFHKSLSQLFRLRTEKRKREQNEATLSPEDENLAIGFVPQEQTTPPVTSNPDAEPASVSEPNPATGNAVPQLQPLNSRL